MKYRMAQPHFFASIFAVAAIVLLTGCKKELNNTGADNVPGSPSTLTAKPVALSAHCKGYYEYLPQGYRTDAAGTRYPLLIFFHGGMEAGQDSASLVKLLKNGPLKHAANNTLPLSFRVNGQNFKFIILSPQFMSADDSYPAEVDAVIEYAKRNYRVDTRRIYLTGLSFGGGMCWNYVGRSSNFANKVAAMVPVAAYINEYRPEFSVSGSMTSVIAASHLPIWSTHNKNDDVCPLSWITDAYSLLNSGDPTPNPQPKLTVFNAGGHEGWTKTYDPSFRENGMNIYEWMLQYHR